MKEKYMKKNKKFTTRKMAATSICCNTRSVIPDIELSGMLHSSLDTDVILALFGKNM